MKKMLPLLFILATLFSKAQSWQTIGSQQQIASGTSSYTSITTVLSGTVSVPYVVYVESGIARVKKYAGGTWSQAGGDVATGSPTYTRIIADEDGNLFVSYVDAANGNRLAVKTLNLQTGVWEPINGNTANLYVSTGSVTFSISQYSATPRSQMTFDNDNKLYIVYADGSGLTPFVKRFSFSDSAWQAVGTGPLFSERAVGVGIAVDSTTNLPYVVYSKQATASSTTGSLVICRYSGTTWDSIPVPALIGGAASGGTTGIRHSAITFNGRWNPIITFFNTSNSNRNTAVQYNKTSGVWRLSSVLSTRDAPSNVLVRNDSGRVFCAFTDIISNGSGRSVARVMQMAPGDSTTWTEYRNLDSTVGIVDFVGNLSVGVSRDSSRPVIAFTKTNSGSVVTPTVMVWSSVPAIISTSPGIPVDSVVTTARQMEYLNRGVVAVRTSASQVYIGWRFKGTDSSYLGFNVYRDGIKLNDALITTSTNYVDNTTTDGTYTVREVANGTEMAESQPVTVWSRIYKSLAIQRPAGGTTPDGVAYTYNANDCSVGDVDGDGEYEIFLKWDPSNSKDNSQSGYTGNVFMDCYKQNGTRLWRIDLGRNIRAGAHYTQFMVYDFDGDGKAEMACKTADATIDGVGAVIGDINADYRTTAGYILSGPEFLTMFNGLTGAAMSTVNYVPARGSVSSWGDSYGNRVDRFISAVAYLDGKRPSLIMGRGYYTRLVRVAWDFRNGQLVQRWVFDSNTAGNGAYAGQGNHQLIVGDVDKDGKDEVINGASTINDDGKGYYPGGLGHGDAMHLSDMDPDRPGLELWQCHEDDNSYGAYGLEYRDAKTGVPIWGVATTGDIGRAMAADIDSTHKGYEMWGSAGAGTYDCKGVLISANKPSYNFGIWWDGDLSRELLDGTKLDKWNSVTKTSGRLLTIYNYGGATENNGTKANPGVTADLFGDWREEMVYRNNTNDSLLIFTTTIPTTTRFYTLMHDPQYRVGVALENSAYNQPPNPGFYLGTGMNPPPVPNIYMASTSILPVKLLEFTAKENSGKVNLNWKTAEEKNNDHFTVERSKDGKSFTGIYSVKGAGNSSQIKNYANVDARPFTGVNYYRLKQTDADGSSFYSAIQTVTIGAKREALSISPNPVTNFVKLNMGAVSPSAILRLTASDGKVLLTLPGSIDQMNSGLNSKLSNLSPGLYLVEIVDGTKIYAGKLMKK